MKKIIILGLALFYTLFGAGQSLKPLVNLKATIVDSNTKEVLPYATIYNKQLVTGTASNIDGYFELPNNQLKDTIVVSHIGYESQQFIVSPDMPKVIGLSPLSAELDEIVVRANNDFLYEMVSKLKKNKRTKTKVSKTYFYLETQMFNEPIEIIESYYNGEYSNLGMDEMYIKKGRIGLKPVRKRFFRSTESSRLFSLHDAFANDDLFPGSPLSVKKKNLKKEFTLSLNHTYTENQSKIYVIDYTAKNKTTELFNGRIWVDRKNNQLVKISLNVENASIHPFLPIGFITIQEVDMSITKSYEHLDGEPFVNTIDFNYAVSYSDKWDNEIKATTQAFIKAYDFENKFELPYFKFTPHYHQDYRNITAVPYDSVFWNRTTEFRFYDRMEKVEKFILKNRIDKGLMHPESKKDSLNSQLQFPYISWHPTRIKMRQAPASIIEKSKTKSFELDRFKIDTKLYLDINTVQDSLIYQVQNLLDPVGTYYHFYMSAIDLAFINMYFDLMEIQKRKFEMELSQIPSLTEGLVKNIYDAHMKEFEKTSKLFVDETKRGKNIRKMESWNRHILESLNIDNLKIFQLYGHE